MGRTPQNPKERLEAIVESFARPNLPLANIKHPTHPTRRAVESWSVFPDEDALDRPHVIYRFSDNPDERRAGVGDVCIPLIQSLIAFIRIYVGPTDFWWWHCTSGSWNLPASCH